MDQWIRFYEEVMGFRLLVTFDDKDISTEYTSLMSKVVSNGSGYIKFPINEPAEGRKKSQIEEYLDFYHSAGVQHLALATDNIIETVQDLHSRGRSEEHTSELQSLMRNTYAVFCLKKKKQSKEKKYVSLE